MALVRSVTGSSPVPDVPGTGVSIADVSPTDVVGTSVGVGLTSVSLTGISLGAKSDGADEAEVGTAEGSSMENEGISTDEEGTSEVVVASDTSADVGSAAVVIGSEAVGVASIEVESESSVGALGASVGTAEGTGVAPVPDTPGREIPSPVGVGADDSMKDAEMSDAVSDAGIVGSTGLAEVNTSKEEIALLIMVGIASMSDVKEEMALFILVGMASSSDATEDTILPMIEGPFSTSEMIEDTGSIPGRIGAAVVAGPSVVDPTSEVIVVPEPVVIGTSVSLVSVASDCVRELVGISDFDSVVSFESVADCVAVFSAGVGVSEATGVSMLPEVPAVSVGDTVGAMDEVDSSITVGLVVVFGWL